MDAGALRLVSCLDEFGHASGRLPGHGLHRSRRRQRGAQCFVAAIDDLLSRPFPRRGVPLSRCSPCVRPWLARLPCIAVAGLLRDGFGELRRSRRPLESLEARGRGESHPSRVWHRGLFALPAVRLPVATHPLSQATMPAVSLPVATHPHRHPHLAHPHPALPLPRFTNPSSSNAPPVSPPTLH